MGEPSQFREPSRNAPTQLSPDRANLLWEEFRAGHNLIGRAAVRSPALHSTVAQTHLLFTPCGESR